MRWDFRNKRLKKSGRQETTYQNPLYAKKNWQQYIIEKFNFFSWLTLLVFISFVYLIFYSPLLIIKKIEINGTINIPAKILEQDFIKWQLQQRKWLIFKQNNILLFSKDWLRKNIENKYGFDSLIIDKQFPNTLKIDITEKTPKLVWITGDKSYYLDENGFIASQINNIESATNLPQIIDEGNSDVRPGQEILTSSKINFINELINKISKVKSIEIENISTPHQLSTQVNVNTTIGYQINFDIMQNIDDQILRLNRVLAESETGNSPQEYIDLRFGERVIVK